MSAEQLPTSPTNAQQALRLLVVGLTAATIYVCWSLWPPVILAAWTAALARPLLLRLERALKGRSRAAAVLTLLLFLLVLLPLASGAEVPSFEVPRTFEAALELLRRYGEQGWSLLGVLAGAAASGMVGLLIYFGGAFVFLVDGRAISAWMYQHSPLEPAHLRRFTAAFQETGRGLLVGVGLTSATQGLVATLIYLGLGVPRWWVLGPITGLASMIPLVGSTLVWGPIAAGLFLSAHPIKASILVALGLGLIGSVDNLLRPVFARFGSLKMPTFLLFVSIFGGLVAFGTWGALLGPLVVRLWLEALEIRSAKQHQ
jgi:predicted PurR-regulated permease PerM